MKIVTWNAEGMFSEGHGTIRADASDGIRVLDTLNADIIAIPEFACKQYLSKETVQAIKDIGYHITTVDYEESRAQGLMFALLSRQAPISHRTVRFNNSSRFALVITVAIDGRIYNIVGTHLDDRTEPQRLIEVSQLIELVNNLDGSTIVLGDFNALMGTSFQSKILRTKLFRLLAAITPKRDGLSVGKRLVGMATGTTIDKLLSQTNLRNISGKQSSISAKQRGMEYLPSIPLVKIDWIFASAHIVETSSTVMKDVGSDHRPIIVTTN